MRHVDVTRAIVAELSSVVSDLAPVCVSHAANAYSAFRLFPHLHMLRYDEVVKRLRKQWTVATPKYSFIYRGNRVIFGVTGHFLEVGVYRGFLRWRTWVT